MKRTDIIAQAKAIRQAMNGAGEILTDEQALDNQLIYPTWSDDTEYTDGDRVRSADKLWKCLQTHTSQEDWKPENTPAMWVEIAKPGEYREIKDDMLSTEAFALNEIGWYQTKDNLWMSLIDNNIYTPAAYPDGWEKVEA